MSEKKIHINKRMKGLPRHELEKLSKTELIDKIQQLEAYNFQLKNILRKKLVENDERNEEPMEQLRTENASVAVATNLKQTEQKTDDPLYHNNKNDKKRKFNFSNSHKRHVLLKLLYFGWDYQGFATQEDSNATIEYYIFKALMRTCLIESRASSNYHRCGRTDKEVSAFCQVISIDLRSKFPETQQLQADALITEIDYCGLLNRILPKNIQCIAWMPLRSSLYSARFDCATRTYRYYFPRGDLNIKSMREACKLLERHADFRNFCKMDVHNGVTNYMRNLQKADIKMCPNETENDEGYTMYFLEIKANAFLWHQIRCIMAILLLIGQEKEEPQVISELLDLTANPCKPQYTPAIGLPLNLFECEFRKQASKNEAACIKINNDSGHGDTTAWIYNEENLQKLVEHIQSEWTQFSIKCTMIRNVLYKLENTLNDEFTPQQVKSQAILLQDSAKPRQYQKLLNRKRCESLENRIDHFVKKQRLVVKQEDSAEININIENNESTVK